MVRCMTRDFNPQAVLRLPAAAAIFLVVTVRRGAEAQVRDVLTDIAGVKRSVGFRHPHDGLSLVVGVGSEVWDRMYAGPRPAALHPFEQLDGTPHTAIRTPGDLLFHIRADRADLCFELAYRINEQLRGSIDIVDEVHGFRYFDQRDLLGFVDGTENPEGNDAVAAVQIGDEDPAFAGGSYVIVQKYLHDLDAWADLSVEEQERVIGRRKLSDIELDDDEKPSNSHVALNDIEDDDGNDLDIVRDNMPFGSVRAGDSGTYFIGYAADPDVIEQMLRNMFIGDPPGNYDRILDFSTAMTGGLFFVPTIDFLEDPPVPSAQSEGESPPRPLDPPQQERDDHAGSLHIGSLKGQ